MHLLRHPPLAFWTVVTAALAVLCLTAFHLGSSAPSAPPAPWRPAGIDADATMALRTGVAAIAATSGSPSASQLSAELAISARTQAAAVREANGNENLAVAYEAFADAADAYADATDADTQSRALSTLAATSDVLVSYVAPSAPPDAALPRTPAPQETIPQ